MVQVKNVIKIVVVPLLIHLALPVIVVVMNILLTMGVGDHILELVLIVRTMMNGEVIRVLQLGVFILYNK